MTKSEKIMIRMAIYNNCLESGILTQNEALIKLSITNLQDTLKELEEQEND